MIRYFQVQINKTISKAIEELAIDAIKFAYEKHTEGDEGQVDFISCKEISKENYHNLNFWRN